MQHRGLAIDGHDGRLRLDQQSHLVVVFNGNVFLAGGSESGEPGVLELASFGFGKELDVLGIAARPAAFNVMNSECVQLVGNAQLVGDGKVDAFALAAIAQGRIVDFDFGFHNRPQLRERNIYRNRRIMQRPNQAMSGKQIEHLRYEEVHGGGPFQDWRWI